MASTVTENGYVWTQACTASECHTTESNEIILDEELFLRKPIPLPKGTPQAITNTLQRAIDAAGEVDRLEVKVSYRGSLYEYKYERSSGWHSFRVKKDRFYKVEKEIPKQ